MRSECHRSRRSTSWKWGISFFLLAALSPAWAAKTPASPVPADRWGTLQAAGVLGDTTHFVGAPDPTSGRVREYHDVDVENGFLFAATGQGMVIFDVRANPVPGFQTSYIYGWISSGAFPLWHYSDKDWYIKEVDAPAGYDGLVALGMEEQGFAVVDTSNKGAPVVAYQGEIDVSRVYAFTSGTTHFAYAISGGEVHRFSLSAAVGMTRCLETPPAGSCPGVYLGPVTGFGTGITEIQGTGSFVVTSRSSAKVWSIANPAAPVQRLEIPGATRSAALWQQGSSFFLARLAVNGQLTIHDVSCIASGTCAGAPPALWTGTPAAPQPLLFLKLSQDGGRPYLYLGGEDLGSCAPQREYLYDLSNPSSPAELTPQNPAGPYWGWYYMGCPTGFNLVGPRRAKVYNGHLYRAAFSLLDVHKLQTGPCTLPAQVGSVAVSPPAPLVCQPVTFKASVTGCPPIAYSWTLVDAGSVPVPGVASNTDTLVWNTTPSTATGQYTATVSASNSLGSNSKSVSVTLSPLPALPASGSFTPTKEDPPTGSSTVKFHVSAQGATAWNWDFDGDEVFNEADWTSDPAAGPNPTFTYPTAGTRQVRVKVRNCQNMAGVTSAAVTVIIVGGKIVVNGPDSGQTGQALQFSALGLDSCTPAANGWTWTAPGGTITGQPNDTVTISWTLTATRNVSARNSACPGVTGVKSVQITPILKACFTYTPEGQIARQPVSFDGRCSQGAPNAFVWDFGDNTPAANGAQVSHTYTKDGTYLVKLSVTRAGGDCPPAPFCENTTEKLVTIEPDDPLTASYTVNVTCPTELECEAEAGKPVTFTDTSVGEPTALSWGFSDGGTASGSSVTHSFAQPGTYTVTLTATRGGTTATTTKTFKVFKQASAVVVPWVARSRGTKVETSDLYVHNPGTEAMKVTLEFRRRGAPEPNPPRVTRDVAPGATFFAADSLKSLFGRDESLSGFVIATPAPGSPQPVVTSLQTTGSASSVYGMAVQGAAVEPGGAPLQLIGMNDNARRTASFGLTNPNTASATYRVRFFNAAGSAIGTASGDLFLSALGQRQFPLTELRSQFGISSQNDYRVFVESSTGPLFPFGINVWTSTADPSLAGVGPSGSGRVWLIGVSNKPGPDGSGAWRTDAVLANTTGTAQAVNLTFTPLGVASSPTAPSRVTLAAGTTKRLDNVLNKQWSLSNALGALKIESDPAGGALPAIFAEYYRNPLMGKRFGNSMAVLTEADIAGPGQVHSLVGLRQNTTSRTTVWIHNPVEGIGEYDVIYRGLNGAELGRISVRLGGGKVRQLGPGQHPLPETGAPDGFTIDVEIRSGKVLAAAQVVHGASNDTAYIRGVTH